MGTPAGIYATNNFVASIASGVPVSLYGSGVDWVAKAMSCLALIPSGGTLLIDDSLQGNAVTAGVFPNGTTLVFTGTGTFGTAAGLSFGQFCKIRACGALLVLTAPNITGVSMNAQAILQTNDGFVLEGLRIDGQNFSNTRGVYLGAGSAKVKCRNVTVANCGTTGVHLDGVQFGSFHSVDVWNCTVGWKNYSIANAGGGNSNTFIDCKAVGCQVGAIFNDFGGNIGMGPNYWTNPSFLSNSVCGIAVLGNSITPQIYWEGGAPENNGTGAASIVIDGQTILNSTVYLNTGKMTLRDVAIQDAQALTFCLAQNGSQVIADNVSGYGVVTGNLVSCDATSKFYPSGKLDCLGLASGLVTWPSAASYGAILKLLGKPAVIKNAAMPNAFTGDPVNIPLSNVIGATPGTTVDPLYGTVASVVHGASVGSQDANRWMIPLGSIAASVTLSILIKASVACSYRIGLYGNNQSQLAVSLAAGVWQRMVIVLSGVSGSPSLVGSPNDASGPTIEVAFLQVSLNDEQGYMLQNGAINTNGN